jgi:hypothetical protein
VAAALIGALVLCLLALAPPAQGRRAKLRGELDRSGYTVVALAPNGETTRTHREARFTLVPPARTVTLQIRDRDGVYVGPLVARGNGSRVILGVRAGAKLGKIRVLAGYARPAHATPRKWLDPRYAARARGGVPVGARLRGLVRSRPIGPAGVGRDQDRDGIPGAFDIDDDGDLLLDVNEPRARSGSGKRRKGTTALALDGCPALLCRGRLDVAASSFSYEGVALIVAIGAAVLAALSLLLQAGGALRRRRHRIEVEVRLGLPIYQQGGGDWAVFVEVTNHTDQPVRWTSAALEMSDGRRMYLMQHPPGGELPVVLQPHEAHQTWTRCRDLEDGGLDLTEPVVAAAKLDSGEVVRSPQRRLLSRSRAERLRLQHR